MQSCNVPDTFGLKFKIILFTKIISHESFTSIFFTYCAAILDYNVMQKNQSVSNTCLYDACDSRRQTMAIATDWSGPLGYYNDIRKWAVNYHIPGTYDSTMTCIICTDIPDTLKSVGRIVVFSGDVKEGCGSPQRSFYGQGIFYITPVKLK